MANSPLDDLRAEVRRRRAAVTKKIGRTRRIADVDVAGTLFDPRRNIGIEKTYTYSQLVAYLSKLNKFQSRSVQFESLYGGKPVPRQIKRAYLAGQKSYNEHVEKHMKAIGDIYIPSRGMTIKEIEATISPTHFKGVDLGSNRPFQKRDASMRGFTSEKSVIARINKLKESMKPGFLHSVIHGNNGQMAQAVSMLHSSGNGYLVPIIRKLTDSQFYIMFNFTNFASAAGLVYDIEQDTVKSKYKIGNYGEKMRADSESQILDIINDAFKFPEGI